MVVVMEADAGYGDRHATSDGGIETKLDGADPIEMDSEADEPELGHPDVATDAEGESPYRNAASVVTPCPILTNACDPVGNVLCPSPALNCYLSGVAATVCTCPTGNSDDGASCRIYSDCLPGLTCIADISGTTMGHCRATCYVSNPLCASAGTSCLPIIVGAKLGYCG
jgi:hypothetical protein